MLERRSCQIELREADGKPRLEGYAAVFYDERDSGTEYTVEVWGMEVAERVAPGAFDETLREDGIHAVYNHDMGQVLAYNVSGTLNLSTDERGLFFSIDPPDTQLGRDVMTMVERGDMGGASIGFEVQDEEFRKCGKNKNIREIRKCKLRDVSVVAQPAYAATSVVARNLEEAFKEWHLRENRIRQLALAHARMRLTEIDGAT